MKMKVKEKKTYILITHNKNTPVPQLHFQITFLLAFTERQMIVIKASTTTWESNGLHFIKTGTSLSDRPTPTNQFLTVQLITPQNLYSLHNSLNITLNYRIRITNLNRTFRYRVELI